ncbi:Uncharacterised protein [Candidatus Tiddalikarchaeum anstoanum]|nr:Uncharacterised protein [Candidatus Tiddalikarchaeum anstoanum]
MGFLKKILGIENLEKKTEDELDQVKKNMKTSWSWVNYLHELEQDNRSRIKKLEDENSELKELFKAEIERLSNIQVSQNTGIKVQEKHIKLNEDKEKSKTVPEQEEEDEDDEKEELLDKKGLPLKELDIQGIGKKEAYLLQILYQMACFDGSSSLETGKIFEHLPYQITVRGLRKKLYKLQQQGIIKSVMYGNTRKWYLDMEKLAKLKQFLTERAV